MLVVLGLGLLSSASAAERTVVVDSFFFEDSSTGDGRVVVDQGDTIAFRFAGNNEHSATVTGLFDSGVKSGGQTFVTDALMRAGTYSLFCTEHGAQTHGTTLVVRGPAGQSPSATPRPSSAKPTPARTVAPPRKAVSSPPPVTAAPKTTAPAPQASVAAAPTRPSIRSSAPAPIRSTPAATATAAPLTAVEPADGGRDWLLPLLVLAPLVVAGAAIATRRRDPRLRGR